MMNGSGVIRLGLLFGMSVTCATTAQAESKYNPYTRQWENVSPDAAPRINPYTGRWELASPRFGGQVEPIHG